MKSFFIFTILFGLSLGSDVLDYSDKNLESELQDTDLALVEFFAPWCGHCKKLAPEYEKAATTMKNNDPPVPLVKIDCTSDGGKETCSKHGVSGYPTLKLFRKGKVLRDYEGGRSADGIVKELKKNAGPVVKEIDNLVAWNKKYNDAKEAIVLCLYEDKIPEEYKSVAAENNAYTFYATNSAEVMEAVGKGVNTVIIFRPKFLKNIFEDDTIVLEDSTKSKLNEALSTVGGLCGLMSEDNRDSVKLPRITAFYDVDYIKNAKGTNYYRNRILKVKKKFPDLNCRIASVNDFGGEMDRLGLDRDAQGVQVVIENDAGKYPMTKSFDVKSFEEFINDYLAKKVEPFVKSEDIPENNDGPVTVVVGKTFEQIVMDSTKDVLIEFYAPWCGHCKSLAPKYDELGEKYKDNDDIVIAKMDATANDVPEKFGVTGFPTLYWVPKSNNLQRYNGGREVDDFVKYIDQHKTSGKSEL